MIRPATTIGELATLPGGARALAEHGPDDTILFLHRGGWTEHPENSMANFEHAVRSNADGVEIDIRRTRDDVNVIHHDADIDGVELAHTNYLQLPRLHNGERIPTLDDTLELMRHRVVVNMELKEGGYERAVADTIRRHNLSPEEHIVISFMDDSVAAIRNLLPDTRTTLLVKGSHADAQERLLAAERIGATAINPRAGLVTPELVAQARSKQIDVIPWVGMEFDDGAQIQRYLDNPLLPAATVNRTDVALGARSASANAATPPTPVA
jgi:glycerophosphoryl diester phosphodiesterase